MQSCLSGFVPQLIHFMRNGHNFHYKICMFSHSSEKIYVKCEVSQGLLPPEVTMFRCECECDSKVPVVALELGSATKLDPLF